MTAAGGRPDRRDLALVHHLGFAAHAAICAPGILDLLAPVRDRDGLVLEVGCGSGLLTAELVAGGLRVIATDASPAMLDLARQHVPTGTARLARLALPGDPLPEIDAIVGVGHVLNYLADQLGRGRPLVAMAGALRPGGLLAIDVCDLEFGALRRDEAALGRSEPDWAIITEFSLPAPDRFVRRSRPSWPTARGPGDATTNVTTTSWWRWPPSPLLARQGVDATVARSFGTERLPPGLSVVIGRKAPG